MKNVSGSDAVNDLVLLIHGIRTRAWWQGPVKALIEKEAGATVIPLKYGYFDLFRFWCPFGICRNGPIARLHREFRNVIHDYPDRRISVIAHSYGTFVVSKLLLENSDIKLHRLILCGSIVPNAYPWARIANQFTIKPTREAVINECGTRDVWPPLANTTTWGYGNSGTNGFGSGQVTDRIHAIPHSGYLDKAFAKKFWVPFLRDGTLVPSAVEKAGAGTPWWFLFLDVPWKWCLIGLLALSIGWGGAFGIGALWSNNSATQNMTINGNWNNGTQIMTVPASHGAPVPPNPPPKNDGKGNTVIQERIK